MINQMLAIVEQRHREAGIPASNDQCQAITNIGLLLAELEADARRRDIFSNVSTTLETLWKRYRALSHVPRREVIAFLQNLLTIDNLCVLDIDIAFDWKQGCVEVLRLAAIDRNENVLFDAALNKEHPRMKPAWEELRAILAGRFILARDLGLTQLLLSSTAEHYGFDTPVLIGGSFTSLCQEYFKPGIAPGTSVPGEEGILHSSLLDALDAGQGEQTLLDHVRTMLHVVQRMAQGLWDTHEALTTDSSLLAKASLFI